MNKKYFGAIPVICCQSPFDIMVDRPWKAFERCFTESACHERENQGKTKQVGSKTSALSNLTSITGDLSSLSSSCLLISA